MRVRAAPLAMALAASATVLAGCGGATPTTAVPAAPVSVAIAPPALSTAPGSCPAVVARTMHAIGARIDARAALHRRTATIARPPALVAALTRPAPAVCGSSPAQTVADAVRVVGERLVRAETSGPEVTSDLGLVARDPALVRAVRRRDAAALRAVIVRFFRRRRLHIVRVRATTPRGRLIGDVGGPFVLAPASRTVRHHGRAVGRVTLSVQDDAGFIKLMRRFTGAGVVLRMGGRVVPGSATTAGPASVAAAGFATRAFPDGPLRVGLIVPR